MKWRLLVIIILVFTLGTCVGIYLNQQCLNSNINKVFIPTLSVIGDLNKPIQLKNLNEFSLQQIVYKEKKLQVVSLVELIEKAKAVSEEFTLGFVGDDGLTATISSKSIEKCYLSFSEKNGWEAININHPASSNIKRIKEIIIASENTSLSQGVNIITPEENLLNITPGQLLLNELTLYSYYEGTSMLKKEGKVYQSSIYNRRRGVKLEELIDLSNIDKILLVGSKGENVYYKDGFFELEENRINYISKNRKKNIEDVKGIILNPPLESITDTYHDALYYLRNNEKVLIFLLDGFGYHQYKHALEQGYAPFLNSIVEAKKVLSVFQPVTNAGMAAIITGRNSDKNGVYSRKQKDILLPDFFKMVSIEDKKSLLIEGNIKILNTGIEPILNIDLNDNGTIDDEIFASARENINKDIDLLMVHFHGIDDSGHSFGDLDLNTLNTIHKTDRYVQELIENWSGKVIITADHGMHSTNKGGDHGSFRYEDLFVPYIITNGGNLNEK